MPPSRDELGPSHVIDPHLVIAERDLGHVDLEDVIVLQSFLGLPCVVVLPHKQVALVGHSDGASIALMCAALAPDLPVPLGELCSGAAFANQEGRHTRPQGEVRVRFDSNSSW